MSRYTGPKSRINRRFGMAIFNSKKADDRKAYPPGAHGPRLRRKTTEYSVGLNEKQKLRFRHGLTEKQFRSLFEKAKHGKGVTGDHFMQMLEMRIDNVVYLLGITKSRQAARQFVTHGHIELNGKKHNIPSYVCKPGDHISVRGKTSSKQLATGNLEDTQYRPVPAWLTMTNDTLAGVVSREPTPEESGSADIEMSRIVAFYSR